MFPFELETAFAFVTLPALTNASNNAATLDAAFVFVSYTNVESSPNFVPA